MIELVINQLEIPKKYNQNDSIEDKSKMKNYSNFRKIITVFRLYGISLLGKRKFDNLYEVHKMDQVFVLGLIFELELSLHREMDDDEAYAAQVPVNIIEKLLA